MSYQAKRMTFLEFYAKYGETHISHPDKLLDTFKQQIELFEPVGWFLCEPLEISSTTALRLN